jgi:hypothetical protein
MSLFTNMSKVDTSTVNGANVTLTPQQSGTTFICTKGAAAVVVTLPDPTIAGLKYSFIMTQAAAVAQNIDITSPTANTMAGIITNVNAGPVVAITASGNPCATRIARFSATAVWSDKFDLVSDGILWHAYGISSAAGGVALA